MDFKKALSLKALVAAMLYERSVFTVRDAYVYQFDVIDSEGQKVAIKNVYRAPLTELLSASPSGYQKPTTNSEDSKVEDSRVTNTPSSLLVQWKEIEAESCAFTHDDHYYETLAKALAAYSQT
jgi:hypothetical protein